MIRFLILAVPVALAFTGCKSSKSSSRVNRKSDTSELRKSNKQLQLERAQQTATGQIEVKLTNEETKAVYDVLDNKVIGDSKTKLMTPVIGKDMTEIGLELKGDKDNATLVMTKKGEVITEFKEVKLNLKEKTEKDGEKDYKMLAYCVGEKCELVFATVYKVEVKKDGDKQVTEIKENYPTIFKFEKRYMRALRAYN